MKGKTDQIRLRFSQHAEIAPVLWHMTRVDRDLKAKFRRLLIGKLHHCVFWFDSFWLRRVDKVAHKIEIRSDPRPCRRIVHLDDLCF